MEKISAFNVRAYGILEHNNKILLLKESYKQRVLIKFPGGGLEFGEGLHDCLIREFKEELNLDIRVKEHFYTQDFFLQSEFKPHEQIILHYYLVELLSPESLQSLTAKDEGIQDLIWANTQELSSTLTPLPVDKMVMDKLRLHPF